MSSDDLTFLGTLAEWSARSVHDIPDLARARAVDALVDIVGCMLAGRSDRSTLAVLRTVASMGSGPALAVGSTVRLSPTHAALVNGTSAHALDFDDNFAPAITHATAVAAPAVFAVADSQNRDGKEVVEAYILALELQARIGGLIGAENYMRGWHSTATVGALGTAGACARMLGLGADGIVAAISIASSMIGGSKKQFGSMMKPVHAGLAAQNAVLAAYMAASGLKGNADPFGGQMGLVRLMSDGDTSRADDALAGLGSRWALVESGLMPKRFPCCAAAHRTLDAIAELKEEHGFSGSEISRIETVVHPFVAQNLRFSRPCDEMEARFSMNHTAARVAQTGMLSLRDLTLERIDDPDTRALAAKVHMIVDDKLTALERVPLPTTVTLNDGRAFTKMIADIKGTIAHPFSAAEIRAKFYDCCDWACVDAELPYAAVMNIANVPFRSTSQVLERSIDQASRPVEHA